jgi:hypothetical protein
MGLWFEDEADGSDALTRITPHLVARDVASAVRLIGALGVVAEVSEPYGPPGRRQANVVGRIPTLGDLLVTVYATEGLPADPLADTVRAGAVETDAAGGAS